MKLIPPCGEARLLLRSSILRVLLAETRGASFSYDTFMPCMYLHCTYIISCSMLMHRISTNWCLLWCIYLLLPSFYWVQCLITRGQLVPQPAMPKRWLTASSHVAYVDPCHNPGVECIAVECTSTECSMCLSFSSNFYYQSSHLSSFAFLLLTV